MRTRLLLTIAVLTVLTTMATARDVISHSNTNYSLGKPRTVATPIYRINSSTSNVRNKIKIENLTNNSDLTRAFIKASKILSDALSVGIFEDFPLSVQIMYGEANDFLPDFGSADLLAITTINYVLDNYEVRNPNAMNSDLRRRYELNKLIPSSIANNEYLADTDPSSPDIIIKLNPDVDFYTDTLLNISEYEYDLTTVILRELVTGCGFSSSLKKYSPGINQYELSYKEIASNGLSYPFLFDNYIENDMGVYFSDIDNTTNSIENFLNGKQVYFNNTVELFNDISFGGNLTDVTLSTLNKTMDADDLMTILYPGNIIRTITPKTKSILERLGWNKDITTSLRDNRCDIVIQQTNDNILFPNTSYIFKTNINPYINYGTVQYFGLNLVKSDGDYYELMRDPGIGSFPLNYSTLPNYNWQRDPETGYIIGYVFFRSYNPNYSSWVNASEFFFTGYKKVLLPYKPSEPSLNVYKINTTSTTTDALISYSSQGATSYIINYSTSGNPTQYNIEVPNKEDLKYIIEALPTNRKTTINVTAQNSVGSTNSSTFTIGEDPISTMALIVTKIGTSLKYQFKSGTEYVNDLTINSVNIYDRQGNLKMSVNAGINELFSIASLPPEYYVLRVDVENSTVFSKMFLR